MASLGQLTAGIAHEINNPINFVSGNVEPLRKDIHELLTVLEAYDKIIAEKNLMKEFSQVEKLKHNLEFQFLIQEINKLIEGIDEGASRTSEIVKGLRNFTRLDEDELKLANINKGIESTLMILKNKFKNRIEVVRDFGIIPEISCYPGQLNQVLMNVLNNASQSISDKGKIFIRTWIKDNSLIISVRDTGVGMSEEIQKRAFEPFFTTKEVGVGTGLGMSITFGIIEKHNGKIELQSEVGKGTEFVISIPKKLESIENLKEEKVA